MRKVVFKDKGYTHFDLRTHYTDYQDKVSNLQWVEKHSFYPFIHCQLDKSKFTDEKILKEKHREIYYSSHIDSYIYQYYGSELNDLYNNYAKQAGINKVAIAYRNCWKGKCNIHFAKEVFEFIAKQKVAYIFVADLTNFFDTLDYKYLKQQIKKVMGVSSLDDAHYAIYKSLTNFAYVDYEDIEKVKNERRKELKNEERFFSAEEFRKNRVDLVKTNQKQKGIPQGSSISSVYANAYMIDFDRELNSYVTIRGGLYRRYCDDIILVVPVTDDKKEICNNIYNFVMELRNRVPNLDINEEKTEQYIIKDGTIYLKDISKKAEVSYLGFEFDGKQVRIRDKSVFKYYCRAYRKVDQINEYFDENKMLEYIAGKKAIYNGYTHLFSKKRVKRKNAIYGNFITYAYRADSIFSKSDVLESRIKRQMRRHWKKVDGRLKKVKKTVDLLQQ